MHQVHWYIVPLAPTFNHMLWLENSFNELQYLEKTLEYFMKYPTIYWAYNWIYQEIINYDCFKYKNDQYKWKHEWKAFKWM